MATSGGALHTPQAIKGARAQELGMELQSVGKQLAGGVMTQRQLNRALLGLVTLTVSLAAVRGTDAQE